LDLPLPPLFRKTTPFFHQPTPPPPFSCQNFGAGMTWHLDQEVAIFSELRELLPTTGLDFELMEIGGRAVRHLKKTNDFFETPCFFLIVGKFKGTYIYTSIPQLPI